MELVTFLGFAVIAMAFALLVYAVFVIRSGLKDEVAFLKRTDDPFTRTNPEDAAIAASQAHRKAADQGFGTSGGPDFGGDIFGGA